MEVGLRGLSDKRPITKNPEEAEMRGDLLPVFWIRHQEAAPLSHQNVIHR
jgi:hypothetical protein